ncbi:MAG: hypothetical protein K0V04_04405 [Deltaproteobacteria bacterium]|nr:hypothetical protein [Deltaproteobacteria bacterium]
MSTEQPASPAVGIVLLGHGTTASVLLEAAKTIVGSDGLDGVVAIDAGSGETPRLTDQLCDVIAQVDAGAGVLVLVDLWGASPCNCAQRQSQQHITVTVAGLNLAMLLKLAALDRHAQSAESLGSACADSGRRAVQVQVHTPTTSEASA